ncbi:MAG TPA: 50S ribosomal protein L30e [Candidatus Bilamarchaeaceae archaeon]|nr:50S ribosomal protein L30e [Candidatus Bilamarchaeaceae archaeon]
MEEDVDLEETEGKPEKQKGSRARRQKKEVVRKRKSQKERENPLSAAIRLAVESGKVCFGSKESARDLLLGKAKMAVMAGNAPKAVREDAGKYARLSGIPVVEFPGTSIELGSICGKPHPVLLLTVREEGVSNILDFAKKK